MQITNNEISNDEKMTNDLNSNDETNAALAERYANIKVFVSLFEISLFVISFFQNDFPSTN